MRAPIASVVWPASIALLAVACGGSPPPPAEPLPAPVTAPAAKQPPAAPSYDRLTRDEFNRRAVRLNLPLFWDVDENQDGVVNPGEVRALLFYPTEGHWTVGGAFTPAFEAAYERLVAETGELPAGLAAPEAERRKLVIEELDQGRPTLVRSDLTKLSQTERRFVGRMLTVAHDIDALYAWQTGMAALADEAKKVDVSSQSLFRRNWGPRCLAPKTEKNPKCSALPGAPTPAAGVYGFGPPMTPAGCKKLEARPDGKKLLAPFVAVNGTNDGELVAVPYSKARPGAMKALSAKLQAAAKGLSGSKEEALAAYLTAAAQSFSDDDWERADEAWSKMNADNSRFYLRVAPDETYWDPCNRKAGFHMTLALINRDSLAWQQKLKPVQQDMEKSLAKLIGRPYRARQVSFHLPDFIDIVVNAGDDRDAFGATIGQSLPNWGKVANDNRGRTVAMTNLFEDADSKRIRREQAASLLTEVTQKELSSDPTPALLGTILHEATHNLGPAHEYKVRGKTDDDVFGGPLAQMLEELKAQTGALYFLGLLAEKGIIDEKLERASYVDSVVWAFGHISRGMWTESGQRKTYSQLAAIQLGYLMDEGVVSFDANAPAANGRDQGAFTLKLEAFRAAAEKLMRDVGRIKARGDKKAALALSEKYVDGKVVPFELITERELRSPKVSFVYAVDL